MASNYSFENNVRLNEISDQLKKLKYRLMDGLSEVDIKVDQRAWEALTQSDRHAGASSSRHQTYRLINPPKQADKMLLG